MMGKVRVPTFCAAHGVAAQDDSTQARRSTQAPPSTGLAMCQ